MNDDRNRWEARYSAHTNDRTEAPSRFLQDHIDMIPRGPALDLACGAGRHAVYLAAHGFAVDAIDIARAGLQRAQRTARLQRLPIRFVQADLDYFSLAPEHYALTVGIRFLNRALWPALKRCTRPLGMVLFETFTIDQATIGHPTNPAYLLAPDELRRAFADFEVLAYDEGRFETETGAAYLAHRLARRPATWR